MQEGVPVNVSSPTPTSAAPPNVQRIMPVLYVNQSNVKSVGSATTPSSSQGVSSAPGPTILTTMPQIQLAGGGNAQIIHSSSSTNTYSYLPVRQVFQQGKTIKETPKKVFVTSINSGPNNKSNQVNLILPNNQNSSPGSKPPITSLILPQIGKMANKATITGMLLPNNPPGGTASKQTMASLLLPTNTKYPNIAPNKKVPIPNIIIPQQPLNSKPAGVPNIIRQTNNPPGKNVVGIFTSPPNSTNSTMTSLLLAPNTNPSNKQPPTSVGLILPTSAGSHGIIMPQSSASQPHGIIMPQASGTSSIIMPPSSAGQSHGIIVPQSTGTQPHSIIVPQSTGCQTQVTNLIITSSSTSTTPVASLLISNNSSPSTAGTGHMTSLLIPQSPTATSTPVSTIVVPTTATAGNAQKTSILVPVSVGPNKNSLLHAVSFPNGKKCLDAKPLVSAIRENKQSVLVKPGGESYPSLPPLQPISTKDSVINKSVLTKTPNGLNVPESLIMTPVSENDPIKHKPEKICDDMIIERTSSVIVDDKGTAALLKFDERNSRFDEEAGRVDVGVSMSLRGNDRGEGVVLDGEVTVRRLGPNKEDIPQKKQIEDDVKIELVKPERQKLPPPRYQKPEDLNPMEVLEWDHQGVGKLPGSNIKFRINEYGLDLVVDNNKDESTPSTPNSSRRNSVDKPTNTENKTVKEALDEGTDKIYCCEGCGCYGLYTEFLMDTRFCSVGCMKIVLARNEIKKKRQDDKLREIRMRRKRRRTQILAQRAKRGSTDQKNGKDLGDNKMKKAEKDTKNNTDSEDTRAVPSAASDSDVSGSFSKSSQLSEDDASSDKTTANSDQGKEAPLLSSTGEFIWPTYLRDYCNKAKAASVKLFKDPFPYGKNGFKIGMKLEGIDPEHQAVISVLTVSQVRGHRIRLHFDGYPDHHDFWANSDSPDIFPPGWCERNNHTLDPPRGYTVDNFSWNTYLKQCRSQPAPKSLFPKCNTPLCPSQFRVGMKLEAVDRKNSSLICVASVANLIDNRLLIHFDSWGDVYDYWTDPSSPYIHPVGWCEEYGHDLTPPNTYKNPNLFSWEAYLKETKSQAAPARAFKPRPPNGFKRGMKLEAIDRRAPTHLRPATVKEATDYQIKIVFDGYPDEFGYWVDDDHPDIHPTGWGHKTGHPVTPPPMPSTLETVKIVCPTQNCRGEGNVKGGFLTRHTTEALCPYSPQNLNKDMVDRFCVNPDFYEVPEPINKAKTTSSKPEPAEESSSESRVKTRNSSSLSLKEEVKEETKIKTEPEEKTEERIERRGRKRKLPYTESRVEQLDRLRKELIQTVFDPGYKPAGDEQEMWVKHVATLGHKVNVTGGDPRAWNHKQVAAFVNTVIPSRAKLFLDQEIDGESFLMLTQCDLTKVLGLKLGPALKIYNCIILLRQKVMTL